MYDSIRIQNFRGIEDLTINDLGRINLLVGANNVGKTSVLEALALLHSDNNPAVILDLAIRRGLSPAQMTPEQIVDGLRRSSSISGVIEGHTTVDHIHRLTFGPLGASEQRKTALPGITNWDVRIVSEQRDAEVLVELVYSSSNPAIRGGGNDLIESYSVVAQPQKLERKDFQPSFGEWVYLAAGERVDAEELAARLSDLEDMNLTDTVRDALRLMEPRVERIYIALDRVSADEYQPNVRVGLKGTPKPLLLRMLGSGLGRMADVLISLPGARFGVALIDEIEDGIYYENLGNLWRVVNAASLRSDTQVFATTHSLECVDAVMTAFAADGDAKRGFRLHRLERSGDDLQCTSYTYEDLEETRALNWEFR